MINPRTRQNYLNIIAEIENAGAVPIVMQYPTLSIGKIRDLVSGNSKVILVSNQASFIEAEKTYSYKELFSDRFAGSFGQ